jgi:hypothetical protein
VPHVSPPSLTGFSGDLLLLALLGIIILGLFVIRRGLSK